MIVLLVNDHLLKQVWPGFVTGKLSDVAGLLVVPPLLALVPALVLTLVQAPAPTPPAARRADLAATAVTGVLFALVKTTETGAEAASHVWTLAAGPSRVLADPTDLIALPALALAWWARGRGLTAPASPRPRVPLLPRLRVPFPPRLRALLIVPPALLAVTATSSYTGPPSAVSVEVKGERITVHADNGYGWTSTDRGATWDTGPLEPAAARATPPRSAMCVPYLANRCYRVVPGRLAVEQSDDGSRTWTPSWSLPADDRMRMARQVPPIAPASSGLAVQGWRGGHVVVVANGADGILLRDESGTWRRLGWPGASDDRDLDLDLDLGPELSTALFLAGCLLFGAAGAGMRRYHRAYLGFAAAACLGFLGVAFSGRTSDPGLLGLAERVMEHWFAGLMIPVAALTACVLLCAGKPRPAPVAVGVLGAPLVFVTVYLPFELWAGGVLRAYWAAVALAVLLTGLAVAACLLLVRRDAGKGAGEAAAAEPWPGPSRPA
ncbi:hypothetical protein [Nonomuraea sp. NPDC050783]|uniref:hypothetical protein n=1 Tax=Nonomuraea sp. NPDC050783 TaxID=3154634 RepID=UPI003467BB9D